MISSVFVVDRDAFFLAISITTLESIVNVSGLRVIKHPSTVHLINMVFKTHFTVIVFYL